MSHKAIFGYCVFIAILCSCVRLPFRSLTKDGLKLSPDKNETVWLPSVDDYVDDVMQNVNGYEKPKRDQVSKQVSWMFVWIAGGLFVFGMACFIIAYLTKFYKANVVGAMSLCGSGVAVGFAELAPFMWTIPAACVIGIVIWFICHLNKDFSLFLWIKSKLGNYNSKSEQG